MWEYSGANSFSIMSNAWPARLPCLLSSSIPTMNLLSTCSTFMSASIAATFLLRALENPSVVWEPQKIWPACLSRSYISASTVANPLLCTVLSVMWTSIRL